jgi:hypothetical protein
MLRRGQFFTDTQTLQRLRISTLATVPKNQDNPREMIDMTVHGVAVCLLVCSRIYEGNLARISVAPLVTVNTPVRRSDLHQPSIWTEAAPH